MAFEIKDGRFVARMYYMEISAPAPRGNIIAFIYRDKGVEANEWLLHYRMRYYEDNKVHDSADRRSQDYVYRLTGTFEEVYPKVQGMLDVMRAVSGNHPIQEAIADSDKAEVIAAVLSTQEWASMNNSLKKMSPTAAPGQA